MNISYVKHANIDKEKWDRCIDSAVNGLIYAHSYYLDAMSKNWDALIMQDYEAVMPLTWNKKFGVFYLRQPAFTQQLGIFGKSTFNNNVTEEFINKVPEHFSFIEINLNYTNEYKINSKKCNLILKLNNSFTEIEKGFKNDLIKNIKKATKNNLVYQPSEEIEKTIKIYKNAYAERFHNDENNYTNFLQLCFVLKKKEQVFVRKVSSSQGELLAIALFLKDNKRIYNIMSTTLPNGRNLEATHFLLHELIKEFSGRNLILDFEGSEIPSINFFYKKFGAIEESYPFVKINKLKTSQRLFKRFYDQYKSSKKK